MRNKEKDAAEMTIKRQKMLEEGFRLFSEKSIEMVSMSDVAKACGFGRITLYRYFNSKLELVIAVGVWAWEKYISENVTRFSEMPIDNLTAMQLFEMRLDYFIDMYRNHADLLRFNQFFNIYVKSEHANEKDLAPYLEVIRKISGNFHIIYQKALQDGTLRTDIPEQKMFTGALHIMLAAVTRYAVGLVYTPESGTDEVDELIQLKRMLLREYTSEQCI